MARIITKGLLGLEDLAIGTSTFTRATSVGGMQVLHQINATNLGSGFPVNLSSPIVPSGAVNGVNVTFTLPTSPGPIVLVFQNGLLQNQGALNAYTISGSTITFNIAPLIGDSILVVY
jgi:hypothetical protein